MRPDRILAAASGCLLIFVLLVGSSGCSGEADFSDVAPHAPPLDANAHRDDLTAIDRLVFEDGPFQEARRTALVQRLEALATRVAGASRSRFHALEALEIRALAGRARSLRPDAPRAPLESGWMRLRSNLFEDEWWFARSARDLEAVPAPVAGTAGVAEQRPSSEHGSPYTDGQASPAGEGHSGLLKGRWKVKELHQNDRPTHDAELEAATFVFEEQQLTISGPREPPKRYAATYVADEHGTAIRLSAREASSKPVENGWMLYELHGEDLRVAFFDGLGERPSSFAPSPGQSKALLVVRLGRKGRS